MLVLILNGGSSSLKYHLFNMSSDTTLFQGIIKKINSPVPEHTYTLLNGNSVTESLTLTPDQNPLLKVFATLKHNSTMKPEDIKLIGHRVVHGGELFLAPAIINDEVEKKIENYNHLAPLHNPFNLNIIRTARQRLPYATHIAVFDTAFHNTIPDYAFTYGLPYEYYKEDHVRRYGFHGNSHEYVALKASQYLERPLRRLKIISCHLGNGASVTAIDRGRSIDTSMGFTPLEGLIMGTRSGDIDPALVGYLSKEKNLSLRDLDSILNEKSGLLGVSGVSGDMMEIEKAAEEGDNRALLAIKMYCYRVKKYIGAYMLALGWVNAIIFTGGIGEHSRGIRMRILQDTEKFGVGISEEKNRRAKVDFSHPVADISSKASHAHILVVATNEELMMAKKCVQAMDYDLGSLKSIPEGVKQIPIAVSAHHVHLCRADIDILFGENHKLTPIKDLSQPGQFACEEKVHLMGPRGEVKNVRVLGPERDQSQVEISRTEEFILGIDAPIRESGDLDGSPAITLVGPKGRVELSQGVICAKRHIHMTPEDATLSAVSNGDIVMIRVSGNERELIFGDVLVRVSDSYSLEMHIDTDEANAAELSPGATGELVSIQKKKS
ncbi:MAG: acetate/propionate family kinase [Spirochaetota bacterium]|nr:acetate/propionate family kinase [Spirochaetota bacterium]